MSAPEERGAEASTLRRDIDASEDRILLRRTDNQDTLAAPAFQRRRPPLRPKRSKDQSDTVSGASTTSEVNSDDDAASIVSRISRIVVQEEVRLQSPGEPEHKPAEARPLKRQSLGSLQAPAGHSHRSPRAVRPALGGGEMKQVKSSSNIGSLEGAGNRLSVQDSSGARHDERRRNSNYEEGRLFTVGKWPARGAERLPAAGASLATGEPSLARNQSASHLPERGDLRCLDSSRSRSSFGPPQRPVTRLRSSTAGSIDRAALLGANGMLNIQRSTWTLSQFDEAFNRSAGDQCESAGSLAGSAEPTGAAGLQASSRNHSLDRSPSVNLLIRASKNAVSLSRSNQEPKEAGPTNQLNGSLAAPGATGAANYLGEPNAEHRRPSHCHSIVSVASSLAADSRRYRRGSRIGEAQAEDEQEGGRRGCCCSRRSLARHLPALDWLASYRWPLLWGDLVAGAAVAVLNISTSLSAAVVAETELGAAFRSSIINCLVYALLCSSRHTSFGSWSIMSQMLVVSVRQALADELILNRINLGPSASWEPEEYEMWYLKIIIMYTFLIGLIQLVCGLLNLGNILSSFIPEALCSSMIAATAFTMAVGQLAHMCGTSNKLLWSIERNTTELWADLKNPPVDITDLFAGLFRWIQQILLLIKHPDQLNQTCLVISLASVVLLALNQFVLQAQLRRLFKRNLFLPFEMILLVAMVIVSYAFDLSNKYNVPTCGPIQLEFVRPNLPELKLFRELWFDSLATALISYTMVYIMAKTYGNKLNYEVDCNQELVACGAGNLIGGLFDALPATASFSRTAGQVEAGGNTQMASIVNCVLLVALIKLLGHHVAVLPVCVMSATLFFGFCRMMARIGEVVTYWRICRVDFAIWAVTFVAILTLDMVNGFVYGFIFSIFTMLYRAQNRRCYLLGSIGTSDVYVPLVKYPLAREVEGIRIFQFCGPVHYVCADLFERLLRQKTRVNVKEIILKLEGRDMSKFDPRDLDLPTHIILDFSMISYIDSAGIHTIKKIIEDYQRINVTVFFASLASHVAKVVKSEPSLWNVYKERFYVTLTDAVHCACRYGPQANQMATGDTACEC